MSDFTPDAPTSSVPDLSKRVRYSTGLVLGVDEFTQEQAYFMARGRLLTRALHGYGVVQGLGVRLEAGETPPQITVDPGLAVEPSGQHVCVDRAQCAVLSDWLAEQDPGAIYSPSELEAGEADPKEACLSVVLRYRTCETDAVPIPGDACRSAEEARAPSRLADDHRLALEFEADRPPQVEEHAIRLLGRLLRAMEVRPAGPYVAVDTIRALVSVLPSVLVSVDEQNGVTVRQDRSLAALVEAAGVGGAEGVVQPGEDGAGPSLRVEPGQEASLLRAVEEVWVSSVRRTLSEAGSSPTTPLEDGPGPRGRCHPVPSGDDGLVLGTVCLPVEPDAQGGLQPEGGTLRPEEVEVSSDDRPRLLSTRVLQETGLFDRVESGGPEEAPDTLTLEEVAGTLPTLPFATADLVDPARLPGLDASDEEVAIRIRFHLNTHETVTTLDNAYDVGEEFSVQVFSERSEPMSDYLYLTKESVQDRARLARNVFALTLRKESVQNRPYLRLRFDLSEMTIQRRAAGENGARGEVTETFEALEWIRERPVKWLGHDGTQYVTVFAAGASAGGDLTGSQAAPRVAGLQGTPVSSDSPSSGDHLVFDGSSWSPAPTAPQQEAVPSNAETGLTRIVALNWPHGGVTGDGVLPGITLRAPSIGEDQEQTPSGLAVAFGDAGVSAGDTLSTGGEHDVRADSLTREVFRVYTRQVRDGASRPLQIRPRAVLPLRAVTLDASGRIVRGVAALDQERAVGALFLFPEQVVDAPSELGMFDVRVWGDAVRDVSGRAVDAEFARGQLPTGDRPSGAKAGVQGGTFGSWFYLTEPTRSASERNRQALEELFAQG